MAVLYVIATPIGNREDISMRALRVFKELDALACEDTRVTKGLLTHYGVSPLPYLFSCHDHNEAGMAARIVERLLAEERVGLCSDSGMPCISDPGYRVVEAVLEAGIQVQVIPGACAVETALVSSGLSTSSYTFKGFSPRKAGRRQRFLQMEKHAPHTLIFYESPLRLSGFLDEAYAVYGERSAAVCMELTKKFERVFKGTLNDLAMYIRTHPQRGEAVVVIAGTSNADESDPHDDTNDNTTEERTEEITEEIKEMRAEDDALENPESGRG